MTARTPFRYDLIGSDVINSHVSPPLRIASMFSAAVTAAHPPASFAPPHPAAAVSHDALVSSKSSRVGEETSTTSFDSCSSYLGHTEDWEEENCFCAVSTDPASHHFSRLHGLHALASSWRTCRLSTSLCSSTTRHSLPVRIHCFLSATPRKSSCHAIHSSSNVRQAVRCQRCERHHKRSDGFNSGGHSDGAGGGGTTTAIPQ